MLYAKDRCAQCGISSKYYIQRKTNNNCYLYTLFCITRKDCDRKYIVCKYCACTLNANNPTFSIFLSGNWINLYIDIQTQHTWHGIAARMRISEPHILYDAYSTCVFRWFRLTRQSADVPAWRIQIYIYTLVQSRRRNGRN